MLLSQLPVFSQSALMLRDPFSDESVGLARKRTIHQIAVQHESRPLPLITGMKVGWDVIVVEHLNPNSKEAADFRHTSLCLSTVL